MSDFEDDMDVDAPTVHDTVMFSSDNTTNLPVEAEDSLPWYALTAFISSEPS